MRIGDVLYFSPRYRFANLNLNDSAIVIDAFCDRVTGFYLEPASRALNAGDAFAGGLICCAAIDLLALSCEESGPIDWLERHVVEFRGNKPIAESFWMAFRHGLAHEGYVKSQGQFCLDLPELFTTFGSVLVVNPRMLLVAVENALLEYRNNFTPGDAVRLARRLHRYFDREIRASREGQASGPVT